MKEVCLAGISVLCMCWGLGALCAQVPPDMFHRMVLGALPCVEVCSGRFEFALLVCFLMLAALPAISKCITAGVFCFAVVFARVGVLVYFFEINSGMQGIARNNLCPSGSIFVSRALSFACCILSAEFNEPFARGRHLLLVLGKVGFNVAIIRPTRLRHR